MRRLKGTGTISPQCGWKDEAAREREEAREEM
jgi:hypothetical protein